MDFKNTKELNAAAVAFRAAGDKESLEDIAKTYHIDEEDLTDFMDGGEELATPLQLALATIEDAKAILNTKGVLADWMGTLETMAATSEELAEKITFSSLEPWNQIKDLLGKILKEAFDSKVQVDDRIAEAAGLRTPLYLGIPGNKEIKKLIEEFYA